MKERPCYYCKQIKPISELVEIVVWVCKECLKKAKQKKSWKHLLKYGIGLMHVQTESIMHSPYQCVYHF